MNARRILSSSLPLNNGDNPKDIVRNKRKHEEEGKGHRLKRSKNDNSLGTSESQDGRPVIHPLQDDVIAKDSDKTDGVKSSMQPTDFVVEPGNDRSSCCSLNISTLENSSSKESHENSEDLFANDINLSSDVDDIILDIKTINKVNNINATELANAQKQMPLKINTVPLDVVGGDLSPVEKSAMTPVVKDKIITNTETTVENGKTEVSETDAFLSAANTKSSSVIQHEVNSSNLSSDCKTEVENSAEPNKSGEFRVEDAGNDESASKMLTKATRMTKSNPKVGMTNEHSNSMDISTGSDISESSTDDTVTSAKDALSMDSTKSKPAIHGSGSSMLDDLPFGVEGTPLASNSSSDLVCHNKNSSKKHSNNENQVKISKSDQVSNAGTLKESVKATRNTEVSNASIAKEFIKVGETLQESEVNKDDENLNSISKSKNKTQQLQKSGSISSDGDPSSGDDESGTKSVASDTSVTKHSLKELEMPKNDDHSDKESSRSTPRIIRIQELSDSDSSVLSPDGKTIIPVIDTLSTTESCLKNANETNTCSNKSIEKIEKSNVSTANKSAKEKEISSKVNKGTENAKQIPKMQQSHASICYESGSSTSSSDDEMLPASRMTTLDAKSDFKFSVESIESETTFSKKIESSDSYVKLESVKVKQIVTKNTKESRSTKSSSDSDSSMPSTDDENEIRSKQKSSIKTIKSGNKSKNSKNSVAPVKQPTKMNASSSKTVNKGLGKVKSETKTQPPQKPRPVCHDSDSSMPSSDDEEDVVEKSSALKSDPKMFTETVTEADQSKKKSNACDVKPTKLKKTVAHKKGHENVKSMPKAKLPKNRVSDDSDSSMPSSSDEAENIALKRTTSASMSNQNGKNGKGVESTIKGQTSGLSTAKESTKTKNSAKAKPKPYDSDSSMPSSDDEDAKPALSGRTSKSLKPKTKSEATKVVAKESTKVKKISQSGAKKCSGNVKSIPETKQSLKPVSYDSDSSMPSSSDEDLKPAGPSKSVKKAKVNVAKSTKPMNDKKISTVPSLHSSDAKKAGEDNAASKVIKGAIKTTAKCKLSHVTQTKRSGKKSSSKGVGKDTDSDSSLPSSDDESTDDRIKSNNDENVIKTARITSKSSSENVSLKSPNIKCASSTNELNCLSKKDSLASGLSSCEAERDVNAIPKRSVRVRATSKDEDECRSKSLKPKSKEFISSDSSDDDNAVPVIPLSQTNDGGMKNVVLSKLSSQVVLTKLPVSSLMSPPKALVTQVNDLFSMESSDEEDDIKIISAAVARSAQKAKNIKATSHLKANIKPMQLFTTAAATDSDSSLDSSDEEKEKMVLARVTPDKNDLHNSNKISSSKKSGRDLTDSSVLGKSSLLEKEQTHRKVPILNLNVEKFGTNVSSPINNEARSMPGTISETLKTVEKTPTHSDPLFTPSPNDKQANIHQKTLFKAKDFPSQENDASTMYDSEQAEDSDDICCTIVRALDFLHSDDEAGKIGQTQQNHNIESQVSKTPIIAQKLSRKVKSIDQLKDITAGGSSSAAPSRLSAGCEKPNSNSSSSVKPGKTQKQIQMSERLDSTNDSSANNSTNLRPAKTDITDKEGSIDSIKVPSKLAKSSKHSGKAKDSSEKSNPSNLKTSLESSKIKGDEHADNVDDHDSKKKKKKDKKRKNKERESSLSKANCSPNNQKSSDLDEHVSKKTKFSEPHEEVSRQTRDSKHKYKSHQKNIKFQAGSDDSENTNQKSHASPISSKANSVKETKKLDNAKSSKQISKAQSSCSESSDFDEDIVKETALKTTTERSTLVNESISPMKGQEISSEKSRKRKRNSDVRDDKATFNEDKKQDFVVKKILNEGSKKKRRNNDSASSSEDSQEEEAPVQITFKKMNILDSISKVLSPRRGQISSTPIGTAVRLKTPNASIIRPLTKVRDSKAGQSGFGKTSNDSAVANLPPSKKHQSSSESSSDSEMEVSKSLFN